MHPYSKPQRDWEDDAPKHWGNSRTKRVLRRMDKEGKRRRRRCDKYRLAVQVKTALNEQHRP